MGICKLHGILLLVLGVIVSSHAKQYEPKVAFVCGKGAMHADPSEGWVADPTSDCAAGKEAILAYCQKVYPLLKITNFVDSDNYEHIKGWCPPGEAKCDKPQAYKVQPYRCLSGHFQSDALIVPRSCVFDHAHRDEQCHDPDWWRDVAQKSCEGIRKMRLYSHGMLLPCGTDLFTGVEFVCCPRDMKDESAEKLTVPEPRIQAIVKEPDVRQVKPDMVGGLVKDDGPTLNDDVVSAYLTMGRKAYQENEHDAFTLAKKQLVKMNQDKSAKLMKQWAEARQQIEALKKIDPKGAEKQNEVVSHRFQQEYLALETSSDMRLSNLDSVHQSHVQNNLNDKKRVAIELLMSEIQRELYDPELIVKHLQRYITLEQKDAKHCLHHYMKVRDRDGQAALQLRPTTTQHLQQIKTRIDQSLAMLTQLDKPQVAQQIDSKVRSWMKQQFGSVDSAIRSLVDAAAPKKSEKSEMLKMRNPVMPQETEKLVMLPAAPEKEKSSQHIVGQPLHPINAFLDDEKQNKPDSVQPKASMPVKATEPEAVYPQSVPDQLEMQKAAVVQMSNLARADLHADSNAAVGDLSVAASGSASTGTAVTIAFGVIMALLVLILPVVVLMRRRAARGVYSEVHTSEKPCDISAEDKHILNMQNGYENPTYKLLESRDSI